MRSKRAEWRRDTAESSRVVWDCPRAALRCRAQWRRARSGCSAFRVPTTSSTSTTGTRTCPTWFPTSRRAASPRTTSTRPSARSRRRLPTPRSKSEKTIPTASPPNTPTTRLTSLMTKDVRKRIIPRMCGEMKTEPRALSYGVYINIGRR